MEYEYEDDAYDDKATIRIGEFLVIRDGETKEVFVEQSTIVQTDTDQKSD